jgi:hypothetical protein
LAALLFVPAYEGNRPDNERRGADAKASTPLLDPAKAGEPAWLVLVVIHTFRFGHGNLMGGVVLG